MDLSKSETERVIFALQHPRLYKAPDGSWDNGHEGWDVRPSSD